MPSSPFPSSLRFFVLQLAFFLMALMFTTSRDNVELGIEVEAERMTIIISCVEGGQSSVDSETSVMQVPYTAQRT